MFTSTRWCDNDSIMTRCESAKSRLKKLSAFGVNDSEIEINENDKLNTNVEDLSNSVFKDTLKCNNTKSGNITLPGQKYPSWFYEKIEAEKIIITLSDDNDCGNHENVYYFPAFINVLSRLMNQFPLWSNVMKNLYKSKIDRPTSSNVESYFRTLKKILFQIGTKSQRLRIDEFIIKHFEFLTGELKIANSNLNIKKIKRKKQKR